MGIEHNTARFLLEAKARGAGFARSLMIGRQNLFVEPGRLRDLAREFSVPDPSLPEPGGYAEPFFKDFLGARAVESVDFSDYEKATHIHDLNLPVPDDWKARYDAVIDAGSLEHILNFPTAIKNLMEMVKIGGDLIIQTPANNYFGHGFYQFSAELFYRILSAENGFEVKRMVVFEHFYPCHFFPAPWYEVRDPDEVRSRVQLVNQRPLLLMVWARRVAEKPIFQKIPQQSDYVTAWAEAEAGAAAVKRGWAPGWLKDAVRNIPLSWVGRLGLQYLANGSNRPALGNPRFFRKVK